MNQSFYKTLALVVLSSLAQLTTAQTAANLEQSNFAGVVVPQVMSSGNTTRLAVVYRARLTALTPNATYRYYSQLALQTDIGTTSPGAGNTIAISPSAAWLYTTNAKLKPGSSGSFMTDANGAFEGWFATVNTGNARFTPGNLVFPTISLNSGTAAANDTLPTKKLALDQSIRVLKLDAAAGANNGTGIYGLSAAQPKNFVTLYDNEQGTGRPLAVAIVEGDGLVYANAATFYDNNVNDNAGTWGTIIPNTLVSGIKYIAQVDKDNILIGNAQSATGTWGNTSTSNPLSGATALRIERAVSPLDQVVSVKSDKTAGSLLLYPSPASTTATVVSGHAGLAQIVASNGSVVAQIALSSGKNSLNLSGLRGGIYTLRSINKGETIRFQVR
jgi:hypothetical protein